MFYSKYSSFSPEQVIDKSYQKLCDQLLSLVNDGQIERKMKRNII